jgi:cobalt-precorrin-5B (C1)-methyltransferase
MGLKPVPKGPLREGYTTGANATACAKGALLALLMQQPVEAVVIDLPIGRRVRFELHSCHFDRESASCTSIKDAGDDPDVTDGAEVGCTVSLSKAHRGVTFRRGEGVGIVTLPGLEIGVGEPAINPVPRQMMRNSLQEVLKAFNIEAGVEVTVFVVDGEQIAEKTLNARVGILEGISILGTTGIVQPFSADSYIASIEQGIDVAVANGSREIAINSGARSERYLRNLLPNLPEYAFVHYGNWIGETLDKLQESPGISTVHMGMMLGKASKLAQGNFSTHSSSASWDKEFLQSLASETGYPPQVSARVLELHMARQLTSVFEFRQGEPFFMALGKACLAVCRQRLTRTPLRLFLLDQNGDYIRIME